MSEPRDSASPPLDPPDDPTLPFFAYGALKPEELGYERIADHVQNAIPGRTSGVLRMRDGLPHLDQGTRGEVHGSLVRFASPAGYGAVCKFEPSSSYKWGTTAIDTEKGSVTSNVLVSALGSKASDGGDIVYQWSTDEDPLFAYALKAVADLVRDHGHDPFGEAGPNDPGDWSRFYKVQAAYMLTSSVLERLAFFTEGATTAPTAAVKRLGRLPAFVEAVQEVGMSGKGRKVYQADKPTRSKSANNPEQFSEWAYQIRCNLMHRGKSAFSEAELVRHALVDLHDILRVYLLGRVPALRRVWAADDPGLAEHGWRLKVLFAATENATTDRGSS